MPAPRPDLVTEPSRGDVVARSASEVLGGPVGRYAVRLGRGWRWYAAVLAGVSVIPSGVNILLQSHCIDSGWSTPDQFWHACFSDIPATYRDAGLDGGLGGFLGGGFGAPHPTQPPLTALVMSLMGSLVPSGTIDDRMRFYFALWAVLAAALIVLTTWWTAATVRRFPMRAALVALSPVVALTLTISPDVLGVALTAAGLYAWSRDRPLWAGVLLGLAISARSYPVLVLAALLFLSLRAGRVTPWVRCAGAAAVVFGVILLVLGVTNADGALAAYRGWLDAGAGFGSPWLLPLLAGSPLGSGLVTGLAILGWVVALGAGALLALSSPRRPGVAEVSLVMIAIVLLTGKAMTVQSALWLVPFVALVGLAWADVLVWSAAEALHFIAVWLYLAGSSVANRGLPASWYAVFLFIRVGGVLWVVGRTWQLARGRPPVVDADGVALDSPWGEDESDELAGPLRGAQDQLLVRFS